jgi:xanthine dehydrogenase accessory factor
MVTKFRPEGDDERDDERDPPKESSLAPGSEQDTPEDGLDPAVWEILARWRAEGRRFVMATVTESRGFTPRKPGARMLLAEDGESAGTIGGGAIEREVLDQARELLRTGGACTLRRHLTQELGMCCGGEMTVFIEAVIPAPRLFVFGAGYIAKPLASLASRCGFQVTVVDERSEWLTAERFPHARTELREPVAWTRAMRFRSTDFAVVVTHDHALDQRVVQELIRTPLQFLGMIGSIPKQRKFALRLRSRGFSDAEIARLHTPLGLPIGADTPDEIAVSVVAGLIAARRGACVAAGWVPPARAEARSGDPADVEQAASAPESSGDTSQELR